MSAIARPSAFAPFAALPLQPANAAPTTRLGLLRRFYDSIMESRRRRAQSETDRIVAAHGAYLSDALEREIGERMFGGNWSPRS